MNTENTIAKSAPRARSSIKKTPDQKAAAGEALATRNNAKHVDMAAVRSRAAVTKANFAAVTKAMEVAEIIPAPVVRDRRDRRNNRAPEVAAAIRPDYAVYQDEQRHTCIRVGMDRSGVQFIAMAGTLDVCELPHYDFEQRYARALDYPVKQAAKMYLESTHLAISEIAKQHLDYLCGNTFTDPVTVVNYQHKESIMTPEAEMKAAAKAAGKPAATTKAPAKKAEAKPASRPAQKEAAAKKFAGPAAKTAPAKATKVAAPAAVNAKATKVVAVKPGVAQKVKVAAAEKAPRAADTTEYVLADPAKERKGATAECCKIASKLGASFTRARLNAALVKAGWEEKVAKIKVADCVYFGVFAEAPAAKGGKK